MQINRYIDHTLLKPETTGDQVVCLCEEARKHEFAAVCVNPYYIHLASKELAGSVVQACSVIGFPLGADKIEIKAYEAGLAMEDGAGELDMVINLGALKSREWNEVARDIRAVVRVASGRVLVKVILECCLLSETEKVEACKIAVAEGADLVKTSTGFSHGGATIKDVRLMRMTVGPGVGVKASGGVRDLGTALKMIEAGASRIGTSAGLAIMEETAGN